MLRSKVLQDLQACLMASLLRIHLQKYDNNGTYSTPWASEQKFNILKNLIWSIYSSPLLSPINTLKSVLVVSAKWSDLSLLCPCCRWLLMIFSPGVFYDLAFTKQGSSTKAMIPDLLGFIYIYIFLWWWKLGESLMNSPNSRSKVKQLRVPWSKHPNHPSFDQDTEVQEGSSKLLPTAATVRIGHLGCREQFKPLNAQGLSLSLPPTGSSIV